MDRVRIPIFVVAICAGSGLAQSPLFELASIKPCKPVPGEREGGGNSSPGRLAIKCTSARGLVNQAYLMFANGRFHVGLQRPPEGGPGWIDSEHYEINARAESSASLAMMNGPMLQALLQDRFHLRVHHETREVPAFLLTVAKSGPRLHPFTEGSCTVVDRSVFLGFTPPVTPEQIRNNCHARGSRIGANRKIDAQGMTLDEFASVFLDEHTLGRPVLNKTGIGGRFDFQLEYAPDDATTGPSIFTALQEQLGLKLESGRAPEDFLVIDQIERPSGN